MSTAAAVPQQAPDVADLAALYALYRKSPSSASALLTSPSPPALTLLLLFDELLADVQRALGLYHTHVQLRLLAVLLAWLSSSLSSAPPYAPTTALLALPTHCAHLSYVLQALSAHPYAEWRLLIGRCVSAVVISAASSTILPLAPWLLSTLSTLGQLAMERVVDEDAGVRAIYREVVGWCGVRVGVHGDNLGLQWQEREEREKQRALHAEEAEERKARPVKRYRKDSDRGKRHTGDDGDEAQDASLSASGVGSSKSQHSAAGSDDGDSGQRGSEASSSDEDDDEEESEDEHGHVSDDGGKAEVDEDDEEQGVTKVELVRQVVFKAKHGKQRTEAIEEKTAGVMTAPTPQLPTPHIVARRPSSDQPRLALPAVTGNGSTQPGDDDADAVVKAPRSSREVPSPLPLLRQSSPSVTSRFPLPATLRATAPVSELLRSPQSVAYRSRQFELTLDAFVTEVDPLLEEPAEHGAKKGRSTERREERKTADRDEVAGSREWIDFALFLQHGVSEPPPPPSGLLSLIASSGHLQAYYALASSCKYLLHSQLKSPYGREVATLTALDRVLSHLLRARHSTDRKDRTVEKGEQPPAVLSVLSLHPSAFEGVASCSAFYHLLTLFFLLQKYVQLAISPSLSVFALSPWSSSQGLLYAVERSASLFFQQNASSCLTFFVRSASKLLALAVSCEDADAVITIAQHSLRAVKQQLSPFTDLEDAVEPTARMMDFTHTTHVKDFIKTSAALAFAHMQKREVVPIDDLSEWALARCIRLPRAFFAQHFTPSTAVDDGSQGEPEVVVNVTALLPWLDGMRLQAEGRYEEAVSSFMPLLKPQPSDASDAAYPQPPRLVLSQSINALVHRCLRHCLLALRDWPTLLLWLERDSERADEHALSTAWMQWERRVQAAAPRKASADRDAPLLWNARTTVPSSPPSSASSFTSTVPTSQATDRAVTEAGIPSSAPLLLEPDDRAKLLDVLSLHGLMTVSSSCPAPTSSLVAFVAPTAFPAPVSALADPTALLQLASWDVSSALALDALAHSSSMLSPLSACPWSSPVHSSLLLRLSCATALGQRSLAPLQPFFASCQDAVFVAALGVEDAMMAVDVVQALSSSFVASMQSAGPAPSSEDQSSRGFLLTAMRHALHSRNLMLCERLLGIDARLPFPPSLEHRSELASIKAQLSLERGEAEAALTSLWELPKTSQSAREKFSSSSPIAAFVPVPLVQVQQVADEAAMHAAAPTSLQSTRYLDLLGAVTAILRVHSERDESHFDPTHEQLTRTAMRLVSSRLFTSEVPVTSAPAGPIAAPVALSSPTAALVWLQSFALTSACRFSPRSSRSWRLYGRWCELQRRRLMEASASPLLLEDDDWVAIHNVVSAYESLSAGGSGERLSTAIFQTLHGAVTDALQERAAPAAAGRPLQVVLTAALSVSLPALFVAEESGGDSITLPQSFLRSVVAIAEKRTRLVLSFSRASLAALVASLLHAPASEMATFHCTVEVPLLLIDNVLSSPLDQCDALLASFLCIPAMALTFIVPQLFAALSSLLRRKQQQQQQDGAGAARGADEFSRSLLRALLVKVGEHCPDCVVFELHARLTSSESVLHDAWKRVVHDMRTKQATMWEEEEKRRRVPTLIQPIAHPAAIDPAWLSSSSASSPAGAEPSVSSAPSTLSTSLSSLLSSVERLVAGLSQVGGLSEDLLLSALRSIQSDLPGRVKLLMDEMEEEDEEGDVKIWERDRRRAERYQLIFAPLIAQITHLPRALSTPGPATPHQQRVRRRFARTFSSLASTMSSPSPASLADPLALAQSIAETLNEFKRALGKAHRLPVKDVSPILASWTGGALRVPGLQKEDAGVSAWVRGEAACIAGFSASFDIIRTKTRPKRLLVLGSDGVSYPYLLKSNEDLHVDARLIQTVDATNLGLSRQRMDCAAQQCKECRDSGGSAHTCVSHALFAPTYPVVPLSSSLGILRWLEHATPLFELFRVKRKKERERHKGERSAAAERDKDASKEVKDNQRYQQKMAAYLVEAGLSTRMPRKDWPSAMVKRVFSELAQDVRADTVDAYLSVLATSPHHLLALRAAFTASLSTMSMLGYVLGVGDRHLGNLLVDSRGRLVHIDYNICLDRGRTLPVPEIVPFRLTGVLRAVGGDAGQGAEEAAGSGSAMRLFRVQSEAVMGWLRENRRPLLSLLSTFVHSPIVSEGRVDSSGKRWVVEENGAVVRDGLIVSALLVARVRRRLARIDSVYSGLQRSLQAVDLSMRRTRLLEDIIEREERGMESEAQCEELRGLLAWEMDAISKSKAQVQAQLSGAQRKAALTANTAAQREEVERVRADLDGLNTRYETATDLQHALQSVHTPIWLRSLSDTYGQEQADGLQQICASPALAALLAQHAALIKALRPLLTATSKATGPLLTRQLCSATRQCMEAVQRLVVGLSGRGHARTWRDWEAGLRVEGVGSFASLQELVGELRKSLLSMPQRLDDDLKRAAEEDGAEDASEQPRELKDEEAGDTAAMDDARVGRPHFEQGSRALRRVDEKLMGVEPAYAIGAAGQLSDGDGDGEERGFHTPLSVHAHVEWLIEEATSVDNLSRMYEGWAPWI